MEVEVRWTNSHLEICCIFSRSMLDDRWMVPCLAVPLKTSNRWKPSSLAHLFKGAKAQGQGQLAFLQNAKWQQVLFLKSTNRMPFGSFQNEEHKMFMTIVPSDPQVLSKSKDFCCQSNLQSFHNRRERPADSHHRTPFPKKEASLCQALGDGLIQIEGCFVDKKLDILVLGGCKNKLGGCLVLDISCVLQRLARWLWPKFVELAFMEKLAISPMSNEEATVEAHHGTWDPIKIHEIFEWLEISWMIFTFIISIHLKTGSSFLIFQLKKLINRRQPCVPSGIEKSWSQGLYAVRRVGIAKLILHLRYEAGPN